MRLEYETFIPYLIKGIYNHLQQTWVTHHEILNTFPLNSGTKERCLPLSLLFNTGEVTTCAIRQENEIKGIKKRKKTPFYYSQMTWWYAKKIQKNLKIILSIL